MLKNKRGIFVKKLFEDYLYVRHQKIKLLKIVGGEENFSHTQYRSSKTQQVLI